MSKFSWILNSYGLENRIQIKFFFNQIFTEDFSKKYYDDIELFQFIIQVPLNKSHSLSDRKMKNVQGVLNR